MCEFGVAQGKTSKLISFFIKNLVKIYICLILLKLLPAPTKKDELKDDIFKLGKIENYEGKMAHLEIKVQNELKEIGFDEKRTIINKGFFKSKFNKT